MEPSKLRAFKNNLQARFHYSVSFSVGENFAFNHNLLIWEIIWQAKTSENNLYIIGILHAYFPWWSICTWRRCTRHASVGERARLKRTVRACLLHFGTQFAQQCDGWKQSALKEVWFAPKGAIREDEAEDKQEGGAPQQQLCRWVNTNGSDKSSKG